MMKLPSGSVYQASLLRMRENQQPIKMQAPFCKMAEIQLMTVPLLKMSLFDVIILFIHAYSITTSLGLGLAWVRVSVLHRQSV